MCGPHCGHENKKSWKQGPWTIEPDRMDFKCKGLDCVIHRNMLGAWCGYVKVPSFHPLYHKSDQEFDYYELDVHGGITWDGTLDILGPGWWIGFDCNHAGDHVPGLAHYGTILFSRDEYRDILYALTETEKLADQLSDGIPWSDLEELWEQDDRHYWFLKTTESLSDIVIFGITVPTGY